MSFFLSKTVFLRNKIEKNLEAYSQPNFSFFLLISLAAGLATIGLFLNNTALVIGAMVVAPLVTPIFGFSLSAILLKINKIGKSLISIFLGTICAVGISTIAALLVILVEDKNQYLTAEIITRAEPNLFYFIAAILSGLAGSYAYAKPKVTESITGIAISAAIIPPLSVIGIGLTLQNWHLVEQSSLLYLLNLAGICIGSIIMFLSLGFGGQEIK